MTSGDQRAEWPPNTSIGLRPLPLVNNHHFSAQRANNAITGAQLCTNALPASGSDAVLQQLSQAAVALDAAEMDRLVLEIVNGPDVADGAAAGAHEDRMSGRFLAGEFYARQQ